MTDRNITIRLFVLADCESCERARSLLDDFARDNRRVPMTIEVFDVLEDHAEVVAAGAMGHPTLLFTTDDSVQVRLTGTITKRRLLHEVLPLLYLDERAALVQLRRQLSSPNEEFPKGRRRNRLRQGQKVELLRTVPLFDRLTKRQLGHVARIADELHRDADETLIEQGEPGDEFFVLASGRVEVVRDGQTVAKLGPGDCFGEMSLLDDHPRSATVVTGRPSALIAIHRADFDRLLDSNPPIMRALLITLSSRLRRE